MLLIMALDGSRVLLAHLNVFTLIGYCLFTNTSKTETNKKMEVFLIFWSSLLLVCCNIAAIGAILSTDDFLFKGDAFSCFNDVMKFVFADIAITCSYLETIFKRNSLKQFWILYYLLQEKQPCLAKGAFSNFKELWQNGRFLVIFYTLVVAEFFFLALFWIFENKSRHLILFWALFTPLAYAVYLRNMQFIFYIEIVRMELVKLQKDLHLLVEYSRFVANNCSFKSFEGLLRRRIADKQKRYGTIFEMFEHFQNSFGYSIAAVLVMIYVRVLVDSYFIYYTSYHVGMRFGKKSTRIVL